MVMVIRFRIVKQLLHFEKYCKIVVEDERILLKLRET